MRHIDRDAIYSRDEVKEILKGVVKISNLQRFGFVGSPGAGYFGGNLLDSLTRYWDHLRKRAGAMVDTEKGNDHDQEEQSLFDNTEDQNGPGHNRSRIPGTMESERKRFRRQLSTLEIQRTQSA